MIKVQSVLQTINAFADVLPKLSLRPLTTYVKYPDSFKGISEEELILQHCLNQMMDCVVFDPENHHFRPELGDTALSLFQWVMLSNYHEGNWHEEWPEPKTIAITRGGNQVTREVLFGFEYAAIDLLTYRLDTPLGKHVGQYAAQYPSEYKAVTLALVLKNHPFVSE